MSYFGVVLMKKGISILIIIAFLLGITGCTKEPTRYVADDFSYLMIDGVKYERINMPFDISVLNTLGATWASDWKYSSIYFKNIRYIQNYLYHYDAAKRDPLVWWSDNYYLLYEATLGDGTTVKVVTYLDDPLYVYTLSEDKHEIEQRFENSVYRADNGYLSIEINHHEAFSFEISMELMSVIIEKYEILMNSRDQFNTQDTRPYKYINIDDFDFCMHEYCFVFLVDDNGDFKKALFEIFVTSEGVMLVNSRFTHCTYDGFLPDGKSFTPISEIEYLFLSDEFNAELAPVIEEMQRIRNERLNK